MATAPVSERPRKGGRALRNTVDLSRADCINVKRGLAVKSNWPLAREREVLERCEKSCAEPHMCMCDSCARFTEHSRADLPDALTEIQRLRNEVHEWEESDKAASVLGPMFTEEIQRLREENAALR